MSLVKIILLYVWNKEYLKFINYVLYIIFFVLLVYPNDRIDVILKNMFLWEMTAV